ncbi:MAG: ATP-dependent helicase [Bacteroidota bacterium]|jgi:ATP-dependent DNA helicase RecG|nr:ATP-dependent helicase [Bacteroidota bacterium]
MNIAFLDTPIEFLKGIGPQRAEALQKELGIFTYKDLLTHYPFRYIDRTHFQSVKEVTEDSAYYQLRGHIVEINFVGEKRARRLVAKFRDSSGIIELVWFQGAKWMAEKLKANTEYIVYGKVTSFMGRFNMAHPDIDVVTPELLANQSTFQSVYNSTEKLKYKNLDSDGLRKSLRILTLQLNEHTIRETLTEPIIKDFGLLSRLDALRYIHFPESKQMLEKARFRLKFEELFYVQLKLLKSNLVRHQSIQGFVFNRVGEAFNTFYNQHLPFQLTNAQKRVVKEIRVDMGSGRQMSRLVQGDVGSGKTLVALLSMLLAIDNGFQACLMAPTEILAKQHFVTIAELLAPMGINVALLTGSSKTKERKILHDELQSGAIHILVGTHALIEDTVIFKNLGMVVIDEQHRFGVAQRGKMHKKNIQPPHVLIMTATPIPRTLAMTLYGDLDTSVIDELPPGRKPITTMHFMEGQRLRLIGFMKEQIALGRQVYVVYPLIQESEKMDYQNLQNGYDALLDDFKPPQYQISIVHGKLKPAEKEFEMQRFIKKETQIMVATTVIEVGVNIPNASVMVIESAERFGLSQLHQLRGRVGRGADKSYCVLMTSYKLGADSKLRMETMVRTNDGFEISEVDLKLRGPGDLDGTQQSGVIDLKIADLAQDGQILQLARSSAQAVLNEDPELAASENQLLVHQLQVQGKSRSSWSKIG